MFKSFLIIWILVSIIVYLVSQSWKITFLTAFIILCIIIFYHLFFWKRSYFVVTNEKLYIDVRNWFFSKYSMSTHFAQVKDIAYSKNHIFHYMFNFWTLFIRTSAAWDWSFIIEDIPNIEQVYEKINYIYNLWESWRKNLNSITSYNEKNKLSREELVEKVKKDLLNISWVKEVKILTDADKQYIFKNEEDRNHWVYESIKRDISFVFTHDSNFRQADEPIVLKFWSKVIFPPVSFHEIKEKNTVSSSPWISIHKYLIQKFENIDVDDATILIGFDY